MTELKLIEAVEVVRDENGMFWHPDMPIFDEGEEEKSKQWVKDQGLTVLRTSLENAEDAVADRYFIQTAPIAATGSREGWMEKVGSAWLSVIPMTARYAGGRGELHHDPIRTGL